MMPWYWFGVVLMSIGGLVVVILLWDELTDAANGFARRGYRRRHDVERTRQLFVQRARAVARARIPLQRGARHRRQ